MRSDVEQRVVPVILQDTFRETSSVLREAIEESLNEILQRRILGRVPENPAESCREITEQKVSNISGYYWIRSSNGSAIRVFCDLFSRFKGNNPGWMRVANVNTTDSNQQCPRGLRLVTEPKRTCGRDNEDPGCSSTVFSTDGVPYSKVCGQVIGYQFSSPNAFYAHQLDTSVTVDGFYVDGVSLTHGAAPRSHIWTFAAAIDEQTTSRFICPCTNTQNTLPLDTAVPGFIANNYFCDTASRGFFEVSRFYDDDPLWDGRGCGPTSTCCSFNAPPWFCRDLPAVTTDDIEMRICGNEALSNEDTPVEIVELYIQ